MSARRFGSSCQENHVDRKRAAKIRTGHDWPSTVGIAAKKARTLKKTDLPGKIRLEKIEQIQGEKTLREPIRLLLKTHCLPWIWMLNTAALVRTRKRMMWNWTTRYQMTRTTTFWKGTFTKGVPKTSLCGTNDGLFCTGDRCGTGSRGTPKLTQLKSHSPTPKYGRAPLLKRIGTCVSHLRSKPLHVYTTCAALRQQQHDQRQVLQGNREGALRKLPEMDEPYWEPDNLGVGKLSHAAGWILPERPPD